MKTTTKVCNVRLVTLNGKQVKLFDVRHLRDGAWVFGGSFHAPAKTPNAKLLERLWV